jgi:hypothetical protein
MLLHGAKLATIVSLSLQLVGYFLVPYCLGLFSSDSLSAYSLLLASAGPLSIAVTFYADNFILTAHNETPLSRSIAYVTINSVLLFTIGFLFLSLPVSFRLPQLEHTSIPYFLTSLLISLGLSINKILNSYLITKNYYRLARLGGCFLPIVVVLLQILFSFTLRLSDILSLVLGYILSLLFVNIGIIYFLMVSLHNVAYLQIRLRSINYLSVIQFFDFLKSNLHMFINTYFFFLRTNFYGTTGLFLSSTASSLITFIILIFCGSNMTAHFFIASKLFAPIATINSVWFTPKILSDLLTSSDPHRTSKSILRYSFLIFFLTLICALVISFAKNRFSVTLFNSVNNIPLTILLLLFFITFSQQISVLCTLPQIILSRTALILRWQVLLIIVTVSAALFSHFFFSAIPNSCNIQVLSVGLAVGVIYSLWAYTSLSSYASLNCK